MQVCVLWRSRGGLHCKQQKEKAARGEPGRRADRSVQAKLGITATEGTRWRLCGGSDHVKKRHSVRTKEALMLLPQIKKSPLSQ